MKRIQTEEEFNRLRHENGFIYNDYAGQTPNGAAGGNVLHPAGCHHLKGIPLTYPKFYFEDLSEACEWLRQNRGEEGKGWRRCYKCYDAHTDRPHSQSQTGACSALSPPSQTVR